MSTLTIRLLGPPNIELDGCAVTFDTRKAVALLAYLAERQCPVRRELLALLLCPDYAAQRAAANLRRTLWTAH
jgi:DNA-binding SARP family transcriptional activator